MELDLVSKRNYLSIGVRAFRAERWEATVANKATISFKSYPFQNPLEEYSFSQSVSQCVNRHTSQSPWFYIEIAV